MTDATERLLRVASRFSIDGVLEASATMMAQAAMRRADTMTEALAIYDLIANGGRKSIIDNWEKCEPERDRGSVQ
jgi:hypothetical protein